MWKWILIVIPVVFFSVSLWYQAYSYAYDNQHQLWKDYEILDVDGDPVAKLNIGYPAQIQFSETVTDHSILVWLQPFSSTGTPLTTTYTVNFTPFDKDIVFVNDKGLSTKPQVEVSPENELTNLIHLKLLPQAQETEPTTTITVRVDSQANSDIPGQEALTLTTTIESRRTALWRHIWELLLGPATILLAMVAVLANLGLQRWLEYEKNWREKEHQKEIKLSQVKYLRVLVDQDITHAIQQWREYSKKNQYEIEWQASEIKAELEEVWQMVESRPWQRVILANSVDYFEQKKLDSAKELADLMINLTKPKKIGLDSGQEIVKTISARFLAAYSDHQKTDAEIKELGAENTIKSLLWVYQEFGEKVKPLVIPPLARLAEDPASIRAIDTLLANSLEGQKLLKEAEFDGALDNLIADQNVSQGAREVAERLSAQRKEMYRWPKLWPVPRPAEASQINHWLNQVGLKYNPFGPEQAELDSYLPKHRVYPSLIETSLRGARPVIVFGARGSGKTASALLMAFDCTDPPANPREKDTFPVYMKLTPNASTNWTRAMHLESIIQAIGGALINFFALNPYTFLEQTPSNKSTLAYLLIYSTGSVKNLSLRLEQAGLSQESIGQRLTAEIANRGKVKSRTGLANEQTWLELMQKARPAEFSCTCLLIDITGDEITQNNVVGLSQQLRPLIRLMIPLTSVGIYVKLFLPEIFRQHIAIPPDITVDTLTWSPEELKPLLQARLSKAGQYTDFSQLFDTQSRTPDPTDRLIKEANRLPRQMIHLGNQLLRTHIRQTPDVLEINYQDLESLFDTATTD